ncbi:hypothetical protein ACFE04_015541 [Oxalis oulophora]
MALATDVNDMSDDSFIEGSITSPRTIPPNFRLIITSKLVTGMFPAVDESFVANHPDVLQHSVIVRIRVRTGYEYPCLLYKYQYYYGMNTKIYLDTGWHSFCTFENIRAGDKLQFFLVLLGNIPIFNVEIIRSQQGNI